MTTVIRATIASPLGPMAVVATDEGIALLEFEDRPELPAQLAHLERMLGAAPVRGRHPHVEQVREELAAYWAGERWVFEVPLVVAGTPFQVACWTWLRTIPAGVTRSYAQGAMGIGRPSAVRAFAAANGANRLAIVVPCHRVVGRDGALTGYGGGLERKRALLDHEAGRSERSAVDADGVSTRPARTPGPRSTLGR